MSDENHTFNPFGGSPKAMAFSLEATERLEELNRALEAPVKFEKGQLVKPRPWAPVINVGVCLVIETLETPIRRTLGLGDDFVFDIRIATNCPSGHLHAFLAESWLFEPFSGLQLLGKTLVAKP
jgi:hypothetical protein